MHSHEEPPAWKVQAIEDPANPACDRVRQWLREHNWAANADYMRLWEQPENAARPLIILAEDDHTVIGGLLAETQFHWLKISIIAVHPEFRTRGVGTALLVKAERLARARGCRHAFVDTMDYQAPRFYLRLGFEIAGEIPNWDSHGHVKYYLTKELAGLRPIDQGVVPPDPPA
jgi:ribosomal protein S18 acetylase RimI-like enzyme